MEQMKKRYCMCCGIIYYKMEHSKYCGSCAIHSLELIRKIGKLKHELALVKNKLYVQKSDKTMPEYRLSKVKV